MKWLEKNEEEEEEERKAGSDHTESFKTFEKNLDFTLGAMGSFWEVLSRGMTQCDLHIERLL